MRRPPCCTTTWLPCSASAYRPSGRELRTRGDRGRPRHRWAPPPPAPRRLGRPRATGDPDGRRTAAPPGPGGVPRQLRHVHARGPRTRRSRLDRSSAGGSAAQYAQVRGAARPRQAHPNRYFRWLGDASRRLRRELIRRPKTGLGAWPGRGAGEPGDRRAGLAGIALVVSIPAAMICAHRPRGPRRPVDLGQRLSASSRSRASSPASC